jgi:hypothetical protein
LIVFSKILIFSHTLTFGRRIMQLLRRFDMFIKPALKFIQRATQRYNSDKHYRKHFTLEHVKDLLYFQVSPEESLCGLEFRLRKKRMNRSNKPLTQHNRVNPDSPSKISDVTQGSLNISLRNSSSVHRGLPPVPSKNSKTCSRSEFSTRR